MMLCMSVGHERELCKSGWTDQDAVEGLVGLKEPCVNLGGRQDPPGEWEIFGGGVVLGHARTYLQSIFSALFAAEQYGRWLWVL